jgi:hypothetical protein
MKPLKIDKRSGANVRYCSFHRLFRRETETLSYPENKQ